MLNNSLLNLGPPPALVRGVSNAPTRPRHGAEKLYRTQAKPHGANGNKYLTQCVTVHSYEQNGAALKLCNINVVYPHAFKKLVYSGNNYSISDDEYTVVDLATGATLDDWVYDKDNNQLTQIPMQADLKGACPYCKKLPSTYCRNMDCVAVYAPYEGDDISNL
jgi:hypothetical protein